MIQSSVPENFLAWFLLPRRQTHPTLSMHEHQVESLMLMTSPVSHLAEQVAADVSFGGKTSKEPLIKTRARAKVWSILTANPTSLQRRSYFSRFSLVPLAYPNMFHGASFANKQGCWCGHQPVPRK